MTYADSGQGFRDEPRFRGEPGFREEPDFRSGSVPASSLDDPYQTGGYDPDDYAPPRSTETTATTPRRPVSPAELDDVFDDPEHGEPGMDRMGVHLVWEVLLLVAAVGVFVLFRQTHAAGITGLNLRAALLDAAALGFIVTGTALSLRAAAVNLAAGPIAVAAGVFFTAHSDRNLVATIGVTILMALGVGAVIGILTVAFHVPGWAASLAAGFGVIVWVQKHGPATNVAAYHPSRDAMYWYGAFAALSLLGGILGLVRPIRRAVGRFRPVADPALRRGTAAGALTFLAVVGGSGLAGLGGILIALNSTGVTPTDGLVTTGIALGVALVGGTSAYGRRGGIFGTLFAVTLFVLLVRYGNAANWRIAQFAWAGGAIALGLLVTRLVEAFGRPRPVHDLDEIEDVDDHWSAESRAASSGNSANGWTSTPRQGGWSSQLPARSPDDTWSGEDRWGNR